VKGFLSVVTKRPKVQGREKWAVKCSECSEVMIFGAMCVLSLIYIYVAVCRLCAVRCLIIICFVCYLLITRLLFFNFFICLFSCFVYLFSILCILCFFIVLCNVSHLYIAVSFLFLYTFTDHSHRVETRLQ